MKLLIFVELEILFLNMPEIRFNGG